MLNVQNIRIAIIDDDEDDFFIISDYIKAIEGSNFIIDWCNNYKEGLRKINAREYDIYFIDYRLGSHTGLELLQEIDQSEFYDPIVLLTGKGNKDIDVQAMEYGATDYLIKSELTTEKLERCIRYSLDRAADLKELKAQEYKYRNLFETSKDAVFITDTDLVLTEVNYAATQLFLCTPAGLVNRSLFEFIKDDEHKKILCELFRKRDVDINDLPVEIENSDGESKSCLLSLSFPKGKADEFLIHGILHDITNIKKAELANLQAQKLAANERLMRTLAHEIRNPLNNILLSVDHFTTPYSENEENQKNLVSIMQRNCVRINHIITELLDLTKPLDPVFKKHSLQEIVDESIGLVSDRVNLQKITIHKNYPARPLDISANKSKLVIALTNIMINAIEAMEYGKGELSISIDGNANHYHVSIKDNGKGIPKEYQQKLFEPFFTLKRNGIGLGLSASYSIIQSHRGDIRVESELGKGTEFVISLNAEN